MKANKEDIITSLLFVPLIIWFIIIAITPIGGWNVHSSTYNAIYKPLFIWSFIATIVSGLIAWYRLKD